MDRTTAALLILMGAIGLAGFLVGAVFNWIAPALLGGATMAIALALSTNY